MSSEKSARDPGGASIWIVRLVSLALAGLVIVFAFRTWTKSVLGCARMLDQAGYEDQDERMRMPDQTPIPPMDMFSDSAYDRTFPDLIEPTLNPEESAQ